MPSTSIGVEVFLSRAGGDALMIHLCPRSYIENGRRKELSVSGGVVEVLPDRTRVLADTAEKADEIDVKRAEESIRNANERLAAGPNLGVDVGRALNALRRAQARLKAAGG